MDFEKLLTALVVGVIGVATLTTVLGRSNSARVIDAGGRAFSGVISASLGKGVDIR